MAPSERREQLLDVALDLALERGFHALTMDGVARAAGVTRPVVYSVFVDRAALYDALIERSEQRALAQLREVLPPLPAAGADLDPDRLLVEGLSAYLRAVQADPRTWRVILLPPEGAPDELQARIQTYRRQALDQIRALSAWGLRARGTPDLDADLFARSVQTLAEGAARLLLARPEHYPPERFGGFTEALLGTLRRP